jgi:uncharacterized repeat protein (TIGR01451 family)
LRDLYKVMLKELSARMRRALVVLFSLLISTAAFAQSADQAITSATDSPDPVVPGNNITYTVNMTNNGPDPATNGGLNIVLSGAVTPISVTAPAGFTCSALSQFMSCTAPSFAVGAAGPFTIVVQVPASLLSFPDGSVTSTFSTSGVTPDPNSGNNSASVTTNYDSPQIDLLLMVSDSPDPVGPDQNITYTVPVTNEGPDTATNVNFNVFNNGTLKFQSATVPAGWNCTLPAVNSTPTFTCTNPSFAPGTSNFTVVVFADDAVLGINDGTVSTAFGVNGTGNDLNQSNNSETEDTAYVTPDADVTISVVDSPDPVFPDGNITYTVTVGNTGPDTAPNITLSSFGSNNLRFVSATVPAGWNCTLPAAGAQTAGYTCTLPAGLPNGGSSVLTFVMQADDALLGINDGTIMFGFSTNSSVSDPDSSDNSETESTAYVTPDADMTVSVSDTPDPVAPDGNITYTVQVTNGGPDAGPNAALNIFNNGSLRFQSVSAPAGWSCAAPAVDATPTFSCTNPSFANGGNVSFTLVVKADDAVLGINDIIVSTNFSVTSDAADPVNANNSETEDTAYVTPDAELAITNADTPDPVAPGATITYTQTVTNNGPNAANTTVTQILPASVGFQSIINTGSFSCTTPAVGASGTITCTNASFANGASTTFTLVVTVIATSGTVTDTVVVSSPLQDTVSGNNSATATTTILAPASADLSITKTTPVTSATPGSTVVYTITATNNGPDAATSVVVTDTLTASLLFQSISAPAGFVCTTPAVGATGTITCNAATLANGANAVFTLTVTVAPAATGSFANTASVSSAVSDPNGGNSSGSSPAVLVVSADVSISKTTAATTAPTGSTISYTITVTNGGPDPATNVVVTDNLPTGLQFVSATPSQGSCSGTDPFTCTIGTLANGASATITLQALVTATSGTITNTATVTATEDGNSTNNSSTAPPTPVVPGAANTEPIPTLSEWALLAFAAMLGMMALAKMR